VATGGPQKILIGDRSSQWTLTKIGFRGDGWRKLVPSSTDITDIRKMVPTSDEVSIKVHGALNRLNKEAVQVGNDAIQVGSVTQSGIHF
jgi:hypothetical protein